MGVDRLLQQSAKTQHLHQTGERFRLSRMPLKAFI
jgi:hypothetical protein